jgi:hypothetical protein
VHQLDAVEVEEPAQEVAREDAEPALDVHEEDNGLPGSPPSGTLLPPPTPNQLVIWDSAARGAPATGSPPRHCGRLPDGAWIQDGSFFHLALLKVGALGSKGHERLGSHARARR